MCGININVLLVVSVNISIPVCICNVCTLRPSLICAQCSCVISVHVREGEMEQVGGD